MAVAGALLALMLGGSSAPDCAALAARPLHGGRVLSAEAAGDACRVKAELTRAAGSRIGVELWLPLSGWSGRYVQLGTGGFAGTITRPALAAEVARGNAVAVTDTGHVGRDGFDARWAGGQPQRVIDYGHRSIKVSSDAAKTLTARFYGRSPSYSYWVGCSNGGRQGLIAAQRYPTDWDGVLAGAPALRWTEQLSSFARIQQALRRPGAMIAAAQLPAIQVGAAKLTPPQAKALAEIVKDFDPAYAAAPGGWDQWIVNPDRSAQTQLTLAEQFFGHMVLNRPDWRVEHLTPADLMRARALAPVLDATADLSAFRKRGGKLVIYAGLADPVISPKAAIAYHRQEGGREFTRFYRIPGMLHCQGGLEPDAFGQSFVSPALKPDPAHDIRMALERWVEAGEPPGPITAAKYVGDDPRKGVAATRTIQPD